MKISTEKIKSYFGRFGKKETSYKKEGINPTRDWNLIIVSAFGFLLLAALLSIYLYARIDSGNLFATPPQTQDGGATIDQNLLSATVQTIDADKTAFDSAQTSALPPDPSI
jgi:hypothetical protein